MHPTMSTIGRQRSQLLNIGIAVQLFSTVCTIAYYVNVLEGSTLAFALAINALALVQCAVLVLIPRHRAVQDGWWDVVFLGWMIVGMLMIAGGVFVNRADSAYPMFFIITVFGTLAVGRTAGLLLTFAVLAISAGTYLLAPGGTAANYAVLTIVVVLTAVVCRWRTDSQDATAARLTEMSLTDPLTGVLNRRGFEAALAGAIAAHAAGEIGGFTLVTLDLDNFKRVNDTQGHAAGDEVLRRVAGAMRGALRTGDEVGRLGGDEFAALLLGGPAPSDGPLARIDAALELEGIAASIGAAHYPVAAQDADALQGVADGAMYAVKRGRTHA